MQSQKQVQQLNKNKSDSIVYAKLFAAENKILKERNQKLTERLEYTEK